NARGNVTAAAVVSGRDAGTARHDAAIARGDAAVATDRTRAGRSERIAHERTNVQSRNPRDAQARIVHEQAAHRTAVRAQPMGRAGEAARAQHEAPRVSAAPANRPATPHVAQPNVSLRLPMNCPATLPAPRS